jgi:hemoglobin
MPELGPNNSPYDALGGEEAVRALAEAFYDAMDEHEPALAKLHLLDERGKVSRQSRDRFALFFIGWLGGPQTYMERHGHPRLRMRHGRVPIDQDMRDAWMRAMTRALDQRNVTGDLRRFLEEKLGDLATFLKNRV